MVNFPAGWRRLRSRIDDTFLPQGFVRLDDEVLAQPVGVECVAVLRINPSSRVMEGDQIGVNPYVGLSYPAVEELRRSLQEISMPLSPADLYCPLCCSLSTFDKRIQNRPLLLSFARTKDPWIELLRVIVAEIFANEVQRLSRLDEVAKLLLEDSKSPWFSLAAYEDFLPVALLVLGRRDDAAALVREVRSTYGPNFRGNQWRAIAYAKFADRVEQLVSHGESPDRFEE